MQRFSILVFMFLLLACKDSGTNTSEKIFETDTTPLVTDDGEKNADLSGCYMRATGKDTLWLQLVQSGDEITGTM